MKLQAMMTYLQYFFLKNFFLTFLHFLALKSLLINWF